MSEIYGLQWFTEYGDAPNATWIAEIERLAPAELIRGMSNANGHGRHLCRACRNFWAIATTA